MTMMMFPSRLLCLMETMDMVDLDSCLQTSLITTPHNSLSQTPDDIDYIILYIIYHISYYIIYIIIYGQKFRQ